MQGPEKDPKTRFLNAHAKILKVGPIFFKNDLIVNIIAPKTQADLLSHSKKKENFYSK